MIMSEEVNVVMIPFPTFILKGDWGGTVYSISTSWTSPERHNEIVEEKIKEIISSFDESHHWSVSLRFVKKETIVSFDATKSYLTLVQFRVRDSY